MMALCILIAALAGYFLGGVNGAIIISRLFFHEDVRTKGSGNAGLTNFMRNYGKGLAVLVIVIDVLKTVVAALIGQLLLAHWGLQTEGRMVGGCFSVLGHMYPPYFKFKGGKGVLSGVACAAMVDWRVAVIAFVVFAILVILTRYVSLGSVCAALTFIIAFCIFHMGSWIVMVMAILLGALIIIKHRANIGRLISGTESKLNLHKKV